MQVTATRDAWRETREQREAFASVRRAETAYAARLRRVARHIADMVQGFDPTDPEALRTLENVLRRYADMLDPWARAVAARMLAEVARRDERAWIRYSRGMARSIAQEIRATPIGDLLREFMATQVTLIKSLPLEAAQRVHDLAMQNLEVSGRGQDIIAMIMDTGHVTRGRANLIARTEVARTGSALTMVRAQSIGSEGYIWRTVQDSDVRPALNMPPQQRARFIGSHRKLEGKFIRWDSPPISGQSGERAHAGMIYNCRCFSEPVLPEKYRGAA